jgi:hypothetical protein
MILNRTHPSGRIVLAQSNLVNAAIYNLQISQDEKGRCQLICSQLRYYLKEKMEW